MHSESPIQRRSFMKWASALPLLMQVGLQQDELARLGLALSARDAIESLGRPDMLLVDRDGAPQLVTWWNSFYLCPAYQPTVDYHVELVRIGLGAAGRLRDRVALARLHRGAGVVRALTGDREGGRHIGQLRRQRLIYPTQFASWYHEWAFTHFFISKW